MRLNRFAIAVTSAAIFCAIPTIFFAANAVVNGYGASRKEESARRRDSHPRRSTLLRMASLWNQDKTSTGMPSATEPSGPDSEGVKTVLGIGSGEHGKEGKQEIVCSAQTKSRTGFLKVSLSVTMEGSCCTNNNSVVLSVTPTSSGSDRRSQATNRSFPSPVDEYQHTEGGDVRKTKGSSLDMTENTVSAEANGIPEVETSSAASDCGATTPLECDVAQVGMVVVDSDVVDAERDGAGEASAVVGAAVEDTVEEAREFGTGAVRDAVSVAPAAGYLRGFIKPFVAGSGATSPLTGTSSDGMSEVPTVLSSTHTHVPLKTPGLGDDASTRPIPTGLRWPHGPVLGCQSFVADGDLAQGPPGVVFLGSSPAALATLPDNGSSTAASMVPTAPTEGSCQAIPPRTPLRSSDSREGRNGQSAGNSQKQSIWRVKKHGPSGVKIHILCD